MVRVFTIGFFILLLSACGGTSGSSTDGTSVKIAAPTVQGPVVFMGDSITQNWGPGVPGLVPAVPSLYELVPGMFDLGIAGQTTAQMLARFQSDVLSLNPSVVVIEGGTNDILYTQNSTIDNVAEMASEAAAAGATVIIGTVPPTDHDGVLPTIQQFNAQLRALAETHGYQLMDYYQMLINPDGTPNLNDFQPDEIHPNDNGYAAMWVLLKPFLVRDYVTVGN